MAVRDIGWGAIAVNRSTAWFIHGFSSNESFEHVGDTKAYKIYIPNNAPFNSCDVYILAQVESFLMETTSD